MTGTGQQHPGVPVDSRRRWGGRLAHLAPADLNPDQRVLYDYLQAGPLPWAKQSGFTAQDEAGRLIGPFNAFLHSPRISRAYNDLLGVERAQTELSAPTREIVILTVGVEWKADYEVYAHVAVARSVGVSDVVITALLESRTTGDFTAEQAAAHAFTQQLVRTREVDDPTYARAESVFGTRGVIDMVHLIGLYLTTCALLNAFTIPAPPPSQEQR